MESSSDNSRFGIAKLNNSNYQQPWKFKMKMILIREGTWKVVDKP